MVWWLWPTNTSTDRFMPHGHCYLWMPSLVRLHVSSDALIGLSYVSISATLVYVVRKRQDLPFNWMFLAFGMFIIACGATHFMEIVTLWKPEYWLSGGVKLLTAGASVLTALLLPPLVPKILALPSPSLLAAANKGLEEEIAQRKRVELSLQEQASALREQAQLLDLAHDTIVVRALDGAIRFWNRAAEEMYGWSREEWIGKASDELLHTEGPKPMDQILAELVREGRWEGELVQKRRDGARIVVASRWALQRGDDGEPTAILEINRDVTERERLEEQRRELGRKQAAMHEEVIQRQTEQLAEMSTPLIPITDHVVVMPLVGNMDAARARQVMETALDGTARRRAKVVILDVTGMTQIDTSVAATLIGTASALRMLGAKAVLTGVRPDIAQMLVSLGVDLTGIVTCGTLQNGIAYALEQTEATATFAAARQDPGRGRSRR
jgi:rsbT co-antagonist protein RsbR